MDNPSFTSEDAQVQPFHEQISIPTNLKKSKSTKSVYGPTETRRMTKNVLVASFGFLLLFTAYNGMSNILSSLYPSVLHFNSTYYYYY
jgi:hypothetical protein